MPINVSGGQGITGPAMTIEIGFGSNPLVSVASTQWQDISQYVLEMPGVKEGRQHELGTVEASTCSIRLDNKDRRFDPTNTSSPYYPNVLPNKRLRIRATWKGVTYPVFSGFIDAWPLKWPTVNDAYVDLHAVDGLKAMNLKNILPPYSQAVVADSPGLYAPVNEISASSGLLTRPVGSTAGLYSGSPTFNGTAAYTGGGATVQFNASTSDYAITSALSPISGTGSFSVECWFKAAANASLAAGILTQGAYGTAGWTTRWELLLNSTGTIVFDCPYGNQVASVATFSDNKWHHIVGVRNASGLMKLYVDGLSVASNTFAVQNVGTGNLLIATTTDRIQVTMSVAEVAVYTVALTQTQVTSHYQAASAPWANDLTGTRIGRVLDVLGWPTADRSLEAGNSTMQSLPTPSTVLQEATDAAKADNGLLFQAPDGTMTFFQRQHLITNTLSNTSQVTFGDGAGEYPYILNGLDPVMDDLDLWNDIQMTRTGGPLVEVQDAASIASYGPRTLSQTGLKTANDLDTTDRANYLLGRYKTPVTRVRSVSITAWSDPDNLYPALLNLKLWTRVTFKRTPPGGGARFSQDSIIEGIEHQYSKGEWMTTLHLSPADTQAYLILDDPVYGKLDSGNALAY